jgi:membrane fusion protein, multidrug efflux system
MDNTQQTAAPANPKKSRTFLIILIVLVIAGAWFGINKYTHSLHHAETDDAQIEANISPVLPRVSGFVAEVRVKDNQQVKKGDTLLILDTRDLALKVQQAEAALATAKSNLSAARSGTTAATANIATARASIGTINAQIETAKVNLWRATQDFQRYENLIKDHSITQQQFEQAQAAKETAQRQVQALEEQRKQATAQTNATTSLSTSTGSQIGVASAIIRQREVEVEEAKLNLSYAVITAPADGLISKVNIQPGQFLQAGQSTFSIVRSDELWVVANFKETQVEKMRVGQKVIVHADAYEGHPFEARLTSFAAATGARFALLPPDNASGNFVKVVQRLPVRIEFINKNDSALKLLRAGLNVDVDVHVD